MAEVMRQSFVNKHKEILSLVNIITTDEVVIVMSPSMRIPIKAPPSVIIWKK